MPFTQCRVADPLNFCFLHQNVKLVPEICRSSSVAGLVRMLPGRQLPTMQRSLGSESPLVTKEARM